MTAFFVFRIPL